MLSIVLCAIFVGLLYNLLGANRDLMRSTQIVAKENYALRLIIDSETGLRGFLLTGDENFLMPREQAEKTLPEYFDELSVLVAAQPEQFETLKRIKDLYAEWTVNATEAIQSRRARGYSTSYEADLRRGIMSEIRDDFDKLRIITEETRDIRAKLVAENTQFSVLLTLFLSLFFGGTLAFLGHRQLLALSLQFDGILADKLAQNSELERQRLDLDERNTALEKARATLEEKAHQLEIANRYKSEFLANMSHELRTPLNSSLILAKLLADNPTGNLTSEQIHFATSIEAAGKDLLELINDILDHSKIEAGKLELNVEKISIIDIVKGIKRIFKPIAKAKGIEFRVIADEKLPVMTTDRQRLDQILRNFLSNALKFTDKGEVCLEVSAVDDERIKFSIRDTGIGIASKQKKLIFSAFHQADGTISRKYGGTGLGLSISKNLARLLGGKITVESKLGKGSTFSLVLPVAISENMNTLQVRSSNKQIKAPVTSPAFALEEKTPENRSSQAKNTILLIETPTHDRVSISELISDPSLKITTASNGTEALKLLKETKFDCMVLDARLTDISALQLLESIDDDSTPPTLIVSSENDLSRADEEQLRFFAEKIIPRNAKVYQQLRTEIAAILERPPTKGIRAREKSFLGRRILLVDDDVREIFLLRNLLEALGAKVSISRNGRQALDLLTYSREKGEPIDLVLMDTDMPEMNGREAILKLRGQLEFANLPVIVLSKNADLDVVQEYTVAGTNGFLEKPVATEALVSLMQDWLPIKPKPIEGAHG
jgi:signal transduction histidine kinase/CheY-like chemotaxis protein